MDNKEAELEVANLLQEMGFGLVDRNVKVLGDTGQTIGEIDSIFKCAHTLLIVEVSTGRNLITKKRKVSLIGGRTARSLMPY